MGLEPIRDTMLAALGPTEARSPHALLAQRITYAADIERLWYLRSELMQAVAAARGELVARRELERISEMFRGVLPAGLDACLTPRPGVRCSWRS